MKISLEKLLKLDTVREQEIARLINSADKNLTGFIERYKALLIETAESEDDLRKLDKFIRDNADNVAAEMIKEVVREFDQVAQVEDDFFRALPVDHEASAVSSQEKAAVFRGFMQGMQSSFLEISYAQRDIIRRAIRKQISAGLDQQELQRSFVDAGSKLQQYSYTLAHTTLSGVSQNYSNLSADKAGLDYAWYCGTLTPSTRPFCKERLDKVYRLDDIDAMSNGQIEPVITYCGGYNCRHRWVHVNPEWDRRFKKKVQ